MTYRRFYLSSLLFLVLISAYPIYMGVITLHNYLSNGFVPVTHYQKYIIPYTPISISIIITAFLLPIVIKYAKRYALPAASFIGIALFLASEYFFEQIRVVDSSVAMPLASWQYSLCIATPEVLRAIGEPLYAAGNPAFMFHFYIIAIVIILTVLHILYSYSGMLRNQNFTKLRPIIIQSTSVVMFIGLCILACFTAFYRNGTIHISPLSASLMTIFFIVFGITVGIYIGSILYSRNTWLSVIIPAITALLTTFLMYIGELILMDGKLFRYGKGLIFEPIAATPFSSVDILIILSSGLITLIIMKLVNNKSYLQHHS